MTVQLFSVSWLCHLRKHEYCLSHRWFLLIVLFVAGSLRYWYERSKVDFLISDSAVWNDDAVSGSLQSAAYWAKGLPFVKSLSGYWKFHFASAPENSPGNFHDIAFDDSAWETLPGKFNGFTCWSCNHVPIVPLCILLVASWSGLFDLQYTYLYFYLI